MKISLETARRFASWKRGFQTYSDPQKTLVFGTIERKGFVGQRKFRLSDKLTATIFPVKGILP